MQAPRPPYQEMTDTKKNKSVLGTFTPEILRRARYSLIRAEAFGNHEKVRHILEYMGDTAGLDGRAREDLRDALMGQRARPVALNTGQPMMVNGRPNDGVPGL